MTMKLAHRKKYSKLRTPGVPGSKKGMVLKNPDSKKGMCHFKV